MTLNDKTRLVICEDRPAFFEILAALQEHLVFYIKDPEHTPALTEHMQGLRRTALADLAGLANKFDPSLDVKTQSIVTTSVYHTLTYAVLLFEYMSDEGMQAVSIRLDPKLHSLHHG